MIFVRTKSHRPVWSFFRVCSQQIIKEPKWFCHFFYKNRHVTGLVTHPRNIPMPFPMFLAIFIYASTACGTPLFSIQSFTLKDRTLAVIAADLNNEGPDEIIVIKKTGEYPDEQRWISIFSADAHLNYTITPDQEWQIDRTAAMFEVGDVAPSPGKEIFFLTPGSIRYYAQKENGSYSVESRLLFNSPNAAVSPASGSLPRIKLLSDWQKNGEKTMLVPQFGALSFFSRTYPGKWTIAGPISTVPQTFLYSDQEDDGIIRSYSLRLDYRLPKIFTQDFNGDGRTDLLLTQQESVYVYPQTSDGRFSEQPSLTLTMPGRPGGKDADWNLSMLAIPADLNGDGFSDMVVRIGRAADGFLERRTDVLIFLNKGDPARPYKDTPNQTITIFGITPGIYLKDVNKDGRKDLIFSNIVLGFWNTVKNLISKQVDVYTSVYVFRKDNRFPVKPDFHTEEEYRLDLTRGIQFNGIWPSVESDFDADGYPDLLIARDGEIKVYQTQQKKTLLSTERRQAGVVTCPFRLITDLNRDGLADIIFYEKKKDAKLSILLNNGRWTYGSTGLNQREPMDR